MSNLTVNLKAQDVSSPGKISGSCPFSIRRLDHEVFLIREDDSFGEHPHIYLKLCSQPDGDGGQVSVIVLSDTGVGTVVANPERAPEPSVWTIRTFVEFTFKVEAATPHLVMLSHCHYDHILGLKHFLPSTKLSDLLVFDEKTEKRYTEAEKEDEVTVVSSSHCPSFVTPYKTLNENSLCASNGMAAPHYEVGVWVGDCEYLTHKHTSGVEIDLGITVLHTPGHTPDSLSWYDHSIRTIFIGDSFYQQQSHDTCRAPWGKEDLLPIIFTVESDLYDWWQSLKKVTLFVERENRLINCRSGNDTRVRLAAAHVTASVDAAECLSKVKTFVVRILQDIVPCRKSPDSRGHLMGHWTDDTEDLLSTHINEFSVVAPIEVIAKGRKTIPKCEWISNQKLLAYKPKTRNCFAQMFSFGDAARG